MQEHPYCLFFLGDVGRHFFRKKTDPAKESASSGSEGVVLDLETDFQRAFQGGWLETVQMRRFIGGGNSPVLLTELKP